MAVCPTSLQPFQWDEIDLFQIAHLNGIPHATKSRLAVWPMPNLVLVSQAMVQLQSEV
ncbi:MULTISPECIES: hypothetical protein [Burkholderiaceae]|uniref:hypothetical protein n=1 Tax=Burkholderiaceae TaxID=119060 RepID=UPI0009627D06|nr:MULTISPECIES: hypothetical protein [Burkholderiaceae]MCG1038191.1 hypothetical protein [Mycetohabitans sp. B7]SIT76633.1 hypothetical protein SAMN04487769_2685 [Burkholderia sp. b14]